MKKATRKNWIIGILITIILVMITTFILFYVWPGWARPEPVATEETVLVNESTPIAAEEAILVNEPTPIADTHEAECRNTNWFDTAVNPDDGPLNIDVALIATEDCAATWRAASTTTAIAVCPIGWVCTFDVVNDIVLVYQGTGQKVQVHAGTWRPLGNFCAILNGEIKFANSQTPTFQVGPATDSPACK